VYLQINTVKYDADREIMNINENLQIVRLQFFTDMLLFIYIQSTLNTDWFMGIRISCQWIQMNSYSVTFDYSWYLVRYLMNKPKGKKPTICRGPEITWALNKGENARLVASSWDENWWNICRWKQLPVL
jgi:hypothetical protein